MNKYILLFFYFFISFSIQSQEKITLEDIWNNGKYYSNSVPGFNFLNDGRHYTRLESGNINKYDLVNGDLVETIFNSTDVEGFDGFINSYSFSETENFIILKSNAESIYRRSSKANFYLYNRLTSELQKINDGPKIGYATLSPDEMKIAYTLENNLYVKDLQNGNIIQITADGRMNEIINGSADWVYEEEFGFAKAFFWAPDSKKIAFERFDEAEVKEFMMVKHKGDLYPEFVSFKYPKVGEKNAIVTSHIYNLERSERIDIELGKDEHYIPRISWRNENELVIFKMNRHQNKLELITANADNGKTGLLMNEENKYYIDIHDNLTFLDDESFIWTSEKNGFNHIYHFDQYGQELLDLTPGDFEITAFYGYDKENMRIYYQAAKKNPMERQIYSVKLDGSEEKGLVLTAGSNNAQFSSTFDYYILNHSDINTPSSYQVYSIDGKKIRDLENNENIRRLQQETQTQNLEFFSFRTSENVQLNGWIIKPHNFNPNKKYPVFMTQYGGPGSQSVTDSWKGTNYWWYQLLAQNGYVVACIDNRGTGARGEEFKKMTYLQLGKYETIDQIEGAKYLGSLDYTDPERIGIFGWSYGGYMSTLCLLKGNDVFKAAIAVAPVTSWRWYDTIYTERYMRTEEENKSGYANNSPVYFADQLKGKYLLIHGNADDNVHFQHSAEMANALIKANKQFETYFYPSRNHGIYGDNARLHLYTKMTQFIFNNI